MGSIDLIKSCRDSIRQIGDQIEGAILYIDYGTAESFQFIGAFPLLLQLGARAVCSLENLSPIDAAADWSSKYTEPVTKAVIFTTRFLSDTHKYILRLVGTHKTILSCSIFTSVSEISHSSHIESPLGPDAFHEYQSLLSQDHQELITKTLNPSNNIPNSDDFTPISFSVSHFPTLICAVTSKAFVFPSGGVVSELGLSNESEDSIGFGLPAGGVSENLDGEDAPPGVSLTAHFLYYLADKLDLKLEIFSIGQTSKTLGKTMMDMSSLYDVSRRSKKSTGLLLIDRTIDLFTPLSHSNSFLDRLLSSLPRQHFASSAKDSQNPKNVIKRAPLDIHVHFDAILREEQGDRLYENIINFVSGFNESVGNNNNKNNYENAIELSGEFLANYEGASYLEGLIERGAKDGFLLVKKWLLETLKRENIPFISKGKFETEIHEMIKLLSKDQNCLVRNSGIIKLALAADVASSDSSKWDAFISAEKMLSISSVESSQSLSSEIRDFIKTSVSDKSILSLKDALILSLQGYILAGENFPTSVSLSPFSWEEERELKDAILDAIFEKPQIVNFKFLRGLEKELEKRANSINHEKHESDFEKNQDQNDDFDDEWGNWDEEEERETEEERENNYGDVQLKLELRDRIDQLFKFFQKLSSLRERNSSVKELLGFLRNYDQTGSERMSFLYRLLNAVLINGNLEAIEYHSSAVGSFLKSGFGRFGLGQAKPRFGDQDVLFVFVVGGINSIEIREVMEAVRESGRPETELIFGGTTLLTPDDMFDLILT